MNPRKEITIGLVGKYVELEDAYYSVIESLKHAQMFMQYCIKPLRLGIYKLITIS